MKKEKNVTSLCFIYLGRVVRREQSSSIAIELTFAPPQIDTR